MGYGGLRFGPERPPEAYKPIKPPEKADEFFAKKLKQAEANVGLKLLIEEIECYLGRLSRRLEIESDPAKIKAIEKEIRDVVDRLHAYQGMLKGVMRGARSLKGIPPFAARGFAARLSCKAAEEDEDEKLPPYPAANM